MVSSKLKKLGINITGKEINDMFDNLIDEAYFTGCLKEGCLYMVDDPVIREYLKDSKLKLIDVMVHYLITPDLDGDQVDALCDLVEYFKNVDEMFLYECFFEAASIIANDVDENTGSLPRMNAVAKCYLQNTVEAMLEYDF